MKIYITYYILGRLFFVRRRRLCSALTIKFGAHPSCAAASIQEPVRHAGPVTGDARHQRHVGVPRHVDEEALEPAGGSSRQRS